MKLRNNLSLLPVITLIGMFNLGYNCYSMNSGFQSSNFVNSNLVVNNIEEVNISIVSDPWNRETVMFNHDKLGNIEVRPISTSKIVTYCDIEIEEIMFDEVCITIGSFKKSFKISREDSVSFYVPGSNIKITIKANISLPVHKSAQEMSSYKPNIISTNEKKYSQFKRDLLERYICPQDMGIGSSSKEIYRCNKCYWTGYPTMLCGTIKCRACGTQVASDSIFFSKINTGLPGKKLLDKSCVCFKNSDRLHNGFIYDKRFRSGIGQSKINVLKENNEMCWFYCYSCKKYLLIPIKSIK